MNAQSTLVYSVHLDTSRTCIGMNPFGTAATSQVSPRVCSRSLRVKGASINLSVIGKLNLTLSHSLIADNYREREYPKKR